MPKLDDEKRADIISNLDEIAKLNIVINKEIAILSQNRNELDRQMLTALPSEVGSELLVHWFRRNNLRDFDQKTINRVSIAIKTAQPGTKHEIIRGRTISLSKDKAVLH